MKHIIPAVSGGVRMGEGHCTLPHQLGAELDGFAPWCVSAFAQRTGCEIIEGQFLTLERDAALPQEGYRLTVTQEGISVAAATERGVIWALTTAAELAEDGVLPCCTIKDAPKYPHRGVLMDCARHFFPASEVKKVIEESALAKLNVFHWHLVDDQGWRIESKKFPLLQETSGDYYTQEEIADVCAYAQERGVEVVPEIDMPGHVTSLLAAYPQYSCSGKKVHVAKGGGIFPIILCPGQDATFTFLEELLDELLPLFPGPRVHLGGDEAPKNEWKKCPHCRARMEQVGLDSYEALQGWFTGKVNDILKKHGKTAICWNESLRGGACPKDVQIEYWTLQHRDTMQPFAEQGGKWIYADMFECYLDYPYSMTPVKKLYDTVPHFGDQDVSEMDSLLGMEGCLWSEHITECGRVEELLFPRIYALAELCWSGKGDYEDFCQRLTATMSGANHSQIKYTLSDWWDPQGQERQKEAFGYLASIHSNMSDDVMEQTVEATDPGPEFGKAFMTKFFQPEDMSILMKGMGM
ncbi:MAG: beta-N-acetylhexosaminidase [Clostridiales bacterium]|nr:beta-N-acetylhexosaminidase [Clostridiales bacterium]